MKSNENKNVLSSSLINIKKVLKSDEILCAIFAYDYEKNNNLSSYNEFIKIWNNVSDNIKAKIVSYFYSLNNYEMLRKLANINNLGKVHQTIGEFMRNRYSNQELEENKKLEKVK